MAKRFGIHFLDPKVSLDDMPDSDDFTMYLTSADLTGNFSIIIDKSLLDDVNKIITIPVNANELFYTRDP